jgi:hypothetical protein
MVEAKESSVLFSLQELMSLEEARRQGEMRSVALRAEQVALAAAAEERRRREADEARSREEEAKSRAEAQKSREQAAHLLAIREAEVERARREADSIARIEELRLRQEHERQLAAIHLDGRRRHAWRAVLVANVVVVGALSLGAIHEVRHARDAEAALGRERQDARGQRGEIDRLRGEMTLRDQQAHDRPVPSSFPDPNPPPGATKPSPPPRRPAPSPPTRPAPATHECTNRWDPLCAQLP